MSEITKTIKLDEDRKAFIQSLVGITGEEAYNKYGLNEDETISETVYLPNHVEIEIKLVIPSWEDTTWTEAVIFKDYHQVGYTEPSEDFFGEWELQDNEDNIFRIFVE